jgi:hypothetical protein
MAAVTGTFNADFAPFADAVAEAKITLKSFEDGASTAQGKLTTLANSFSGVKIIQQADLMAEAIERAGGVTTLTANELQRAGTIAAEAAEKIKALGGTVPERIQALADAAGGAAKQTDTLSVSFTNLVTSMVSAEAIIGAIKGAWGLLTDEVAASIKAAGDAEKAHVQLVTALRAQGTAIPSVVSAYEGYASALQQTSIYQDDAVKGAMALLVQVGNVMPKDMQAATQAAADLASGLGKDLNEATLMVAKAAEGNTSALKKSGVALDDARVASEGFGYVLDAISEKFGGQASALAGTYQGRLAQLGNTWNGLEASIGRVITQNSTVLTAFDLLNKSIAANTGELNTNQTANDLVSEAVIGVVRALALGVDAVGFTIQAYYNLRIAADEVGAAIVNLGGYALDSVAAIMSVQKYYNPLAWTSLWKNAVSEVQNAATTLHGAAEGFHADSSDALASQTRWADGLGKVSAGLNAFAANLETTRGQTQPFKATLDGAADSWDHNTLAVENNKKAVEAYVRAWDKYAEDTAKIWDDAFVAQANLDTNSLASHLAVIEARRQADINEATRAVLDAGQLEERVYAINAKYAALAVNETTKKNTEIAAANDKLWNEYNELIGRVTASSYQTQTAAIQRWYDDTVTATQAAGKADADFWDAITKLYVEKWRQASMDVRAIAKTEQTDTREGLQATADEAKRTYDYALTQVGHWSDATIDKYRVTYEKAQAAADNWGNAGTEANDKVKGATDRAKASTDALTGSLATAAGAAKTLGDLMDAYFPQGTNGAARLGMYSGDTAGEAAYKAAGGIISASIGGGILHRATGGPVIAGVPYTVGEQGAETFVPTVSGTILPNGAAPGAGVIVNNVFNITDTESAIARRVADAITRSVMRSTRIS